MTQAEKAFTAIEALGEALAGKDFIIKSQEWQINSLRDEVEGLRAKLVAAEAIITELEGGAA